MWDTIACLPVILPLPQGTTSLLQSCRPPPKLYTSPNVSPPPKVYRKVPQTASLTNYPSSLISCLKGLVLYPIVCSTNSHHVNFLHCYFKVGGAATGKCGRYLRYLVRLLIRSSFAPPGTCTPPLRNEYQDAVHLTFVAPILIKATGLDLGTPQKEKCKKTTPARFTSTTVCLHNESPTTPTESYHLIHTSALRSLIDSDTRSHSRCPCTCHYAETVKNHTRQYLHCHSPVYPSST